MILITGATGLVGSHLLLELLKKEETVVALYRDPSKKEAVRQLFHSYGKADLLQKAEWREGDITQVPALEKAFAGITEVYHCAAFISFDPADEEKLRKTNIEGTANVVNTALDFGVTRFCHVSSVAALGSPLEPEQIISEQSEWHPEALHSDYAISKYGAEMEVWRAQQEGLRVVIVNPGIIIGRPTEAESGTAQLFSKVASGQRFYTNGVTGMVAVQDVVAAMIALMEQEIFGEKFALIAENYSYRKLLDTTADALSAKRPKKEAPKWMTSWVWKMDWLISGLFNTKRKLSHASAVALHDTHLISGEKINKVLKLNYHPVDQAIREAAQYYKTHFLP